MLSFIGSWLPLLLWMALIFWLSHQPKLPHPLRKRGVSDYFFDYAAHAFTFGLLTALAWRAVTTWRRRWCGSLATNRLPLAAAWAMLYALSDEFHQSFVPGRKASPKDLLADAAGIAILSLLIMAWLLLRNRLLAWLWQRPRFKIVGHWLDQRLDLSACPWTNDVAHATANASDAG